MINKLTDNELKELQGFGIEVRKDILKMIHKAKSGHPGGNLSAVKILAVLYKKCMNICPEWSNSCDFNKRDRFVLSKGHASSVLYSVLARCGYFGLEDLAGFRQLGSKLQGHPSCCVGLSGIEASTGSLGQGLSIACGIALGLRLDGNDSKVFVLMGDGELQEGNVWEAVMNASHNRLDNLIVIIDRNRLQIDGSTEDIKSLGDVVKKFEAFGWESTEINGDSFEEIYEAIEKAKLSDKPYAIIADTIKGKGVSFMENNAGWHGKAPSDTELELALGDLRKRLNTIEN